jgi:anaerobic dimethyl sulfoxide reductase subunit C (anchor subunit)
MDIREWALLIFTILGQLAAGALLVLMIVRGYAVRKVGIQLVDRLTDLPVYLVPLVSALALIAALFHLGKLSNIVNATPNIATSWVSREVVIAVLFIILAGLYAILQWRKTGSESLRTAIGWIAAVVGLVQVYAQAGAYMIRTQPSWNTLATPVTFFATALLLGVLAVGAALVATFADLKKKDAKGAGKLYEVLKDCLQGIAIAAIVLLGIEFLVLPVYLAYLGTQGPATLASLKMMVGPYGFTLALRLVLVFIGAGIVAAYLYRDAALPGKDKAFANLVYTAFVLVLLSEVMGRFLFYATHVRIGI